jgi:hypothetical protein
MLREGWCRSWRGGKRGRVDPYRHAKKTGIHVIRVSASPGVIKVAHSRPRSWPRPAHKCAGYIYEASLRRLTRLG